MNLNTSPLPFIIAVILSGAGIYWYFFTGTGNQPPLVVNESENQAKIQFQTLVSELRPVSFNTRIFSDPRFDTLVDLTTPVSPEPLGRLDPFATIIGVSTK